MTDHKYKKLAQFKNYENNKTKENVENLFKNDDSINYQIPANNFFRVQKPNCIGNTALHIAQKTYQIEAFDTLIKLGADITIKNDNDETVIHKAIKNIFTGNKEMYRESFIHSSLDGHVDFGITTNPTNKYGVSHFHAASVVNHIKAIEFFLKNGVSVNDAVSADSPYFPGYTAFHFAVTYRNFDVTETLLKNGADPNVTNTYGLSPLHLIIKRNIEILLINDSKCSESRLKKELESIERMLNYILANYGDNEWNLTDTIGLSRFHVASMIQDTSFVEKAIEEGVDIYLSVNSVSPFLPSYTALHFAAHFNHNTFKTLIQRGGDVTAKDSEGVTPFDIFLQTCDGYFLYDLILHRSEWRTILFNDKTTKLLHFVANVRRDRTLQKFLRNDDSLLDLFIPFNSPIWPGYTFLHLVVVFIGITDFRDADDTDYNVDLTVEGPGEEDLRHIEIIKNCMNMGADVTIQDIHGSTPLHLAFRNCRPKAVNELLKYCSLGEIINPIDNYGLSYLHIACAAKKDYDDEGQELEEACEKLVKILVDFGASPNLPLTSSVKWKNQYGLKVFLNIGWTPLHVAVATSNLRLIKILVERGADIYAKDVNGLTPIHLILSCYDNTDISKFLLSAENFKDSIADCGLSHLHVACYLQNVTATRRLLENGADTKTTVSYKKLRSCRHTETGNKSRSFRYCDACDPFCEPLFFVPFFVDRTPLNVALKLGGSNEEVIELLIQHQANLCVKTPGDLFPFYRNYDSDPYWWNFFIIPKLSSNETLQKCIQELTGITMLHAYSALLDVEAVAELLNSGADVSAKVHMDSPLWPGCTPLHLILYDQDFDEQEGSKLREFDLLASLLLEKKADVLCMNTRQNTPVHEAYETFLHHPDYDMDPEKITYVTIVSKSQKDFSVNPANAAGLTHFHIACLCGNVAAVEEFLKHDADVNSPVDSFSHIDGGFTPLHFAVIGQSKEVVDILLKHGADPNTKSCLGKTSLHVAVQFELTNADLFNSLISAGADMSAKNVYGDTPPESLFKDYSHSKAAEIFLKHGICVNVFDEKTNEGYIASVLWKSDNGIIYEPVFKAPIFHPSLNDVDEMGRSPIHNIVSTDERLTSLTEYTIAIKEYVKVGFDIDRRDIKGRTALHIATQFKNFVGIHALLNNGTDINIKDESCNTKDPKTAIEILERNLKRVNIFLKKIGLSLSFEKTNVVIHTNHLTQVITI